MEFSGSGCDLNTNPNIRMKTPNVRYLLSFVVAVSMLAFVGCDTSDGVGDNLQDAGDSIQDAADDAGDNMEDAVNDATN